MLEADALEGFLKKTMPPASKTWDDDVLHCVTINYTWQIIER